MKDESWNTSHNITWAHEAKFKEVLISCPWDKRDQHVVMDKNTVYPLPLQQGYKNKSLVNNYL